MKRLGRYTLLFERRPAILGHAAMCGKKEAAGPLARDFDQTFLDSYLNQESWEKAESMLQTEAANLAIRKAGLQKQDINMVFAGDLLNQCISSTFGLRGMDIPFLGQYGACSTMAQTLIMASIMVECGAANYACAVTSSHFCTAERQFRTPLEYGSQRAPTAQWTATASGSAVLGMSGDIQVRHATVGRITDLGVTDMTNMGAAMAPAAAQTLLDFFNDTATTEIYTRSIFPYTTLFRSVAGLSTSEAQKSSDMFMKCQYMDELDRKSTRLNSSHLRASRMPSSA